MMWNCEECMFEVLCTRSQILGSPLESIRGILMLSDGLPKKRKERLGPSALSCNKKRQYLQQNNFCEQAGASATFDCVSIDTFEW